MLRTKVLVTGAADTIALASRRAQHNKRFEQSPDAAVSSYGNPVFCVFVWPLRARLPLGTAQLKRSVMFL